MNLKTTKEEIMRVRAGYRPKTNSFWVWSFYGVACMISSILIRIRMGSK